MTAKTPLVDKIVAKARELGLPEKSEALIRQADHAVSDAVRRAGAYADDNRDKIAGALDKAGRVVDEKTQGKYHDKIGKARAQAEKGLDKLAEKRAADTAPADTAPAEPAAPATPTDAPVPPKPTWATVDDQVRGEDPIG